MPGSCQRLDGVDASGPKGRTAASSAETACARLVGQIPSDPRSWHAMQIVALSGGKEGADRVGDPPVRTTRLARGAGCEIGGILSVLRRATKASSVTLVAERTTANLICSPLFLAYRLQLLAPTGHESASELGISCNDIRQQSFFHTRGTRHAYMVGVWRKRLRI